MRGKDLHLDCFSGLAGDMFLGACLDMGMPAAVVAEAVASLKLHGIGIEARKSTRAGFAGTRSALRQQEHGLRTPPRPAAFADHGIRPTAAWQTE